MEEGDELALADVEVEAADGDALRRRYIQMFLPALRAPAASRLTAPGASWEEISRAWNP